MANIEGSYPPVQRVRTWYWSLDRAMSGGKELGVPLTFIEVFGFQGIGKTSLVTYLAGLMAEAINKNVIYAPIEHIDVSYMGRILDSAKFNGLATVLGNWDMVKKFMPEYKPKKGEYVTDELLIDCLLAATRDPDYGVAVLDSLSTLMPISEMESSVADANMGRKGKLVSNLSRGLIHANRFRNNEPFGVFLLSHKYPPMGGGTPSNTGTSTTGGEMKKNISKVRVGLRRIKDVGQFYEDSKGTPYDEHAYVLEGKVEKNNFGREGKIFYVVGLGGKGFHRGLTAMYECKATKLATFGQNVTLGGTKFGSIRSLVERAHAGEEEVFQPFIDALNNPSSVSKAEPEEEEIPDWMADELPE